MGKQQQPIILFDSGVGGLSIYRAIKQQRPQQAVIYCSDNAGFPYGIKSEREVISRTCYYLTAMAKRYKPALVVVACNTASTVSLPKIRQALDIPVVGVVPAIKIARQRAKNRCIGLLATPATVRQSYTDQLIRDFASDCRVIRVGSNELVQLAEEHLRGQAVCRARLRAIVTPFFDCNPAVWPDTIVLGCTHFPLLRDLLASVTPILVNWVDSGEAIARRVNSLLGSALVPALCPADTFVYTGTAHAVKPLRQTLATLGFHCCEQLDSDAYRYETGCLFNYSE